MFKRDAGSVPSEEDYIGDLPAHVPEYITSPAKNARAVETCSACGVDGGDDGGVLYHSG